MVRLLEFLAAHRDEMVQDLGQLVEMESPSGDVAALGAVSRHLADLARRLTGGKISTIPSAGGAAHLRLALQGSEPGAGPVLLVGHFDTVWPVGTLAEMPWRVAGGKAHGPGVYDMKAGLIQGLWALRALREVAGGHPPIVFLMNSDEEIGSLTSRPLIEHEARAARASLILEPAFHGAVKTGRKGVGMFTLEVRGKAAHAGSEPWEGASAIGEAARLVTLLHAQTNRLTGTTVNVGTIEGGTRSNVVAASARLAVDLRVATGDEGDRLSSLIRGLQAEDPRAAVTTVGGMNRPPFERTPAVVSLYEKARAISGELGLPPLEEAQVGGGSDGNFCALVNPNVLDGLGAVGDGAHALTEHVEIEQLAPRAALLAGLINSI